MAFTHELAIDTPQSIPEFVTDFRKVFTSDKLTMAEITLEPYKTSNPSEGLAGVTGKDADRFNFKVPGLRNVALTYPYFHDGEAPTLTEAVDVMGRLQLGRTFTPQENADIVAFLKTLTGDQPKIVLPILPPSNDKTPKPKPKPKPFE